LALNSKIDFWVQTEPFIKQFFREKKNPSNPSKEVIKPYEVNCTPITTICCTVSACFVQIMDRSQLCVVSEKSKENYNMWVKTNSSI